MAWNNPATWLANTVLTATQLNQQVRDNFKALGDASTAYTPAWTATTTNPAIVNGSLTGGYRQVGKHVKTWMRVVPGSSTTFGSGIYSLGLPAGMTPITGRWPFTGTLVDTSAGLTYPLFGYYISGAVRLVTLPTSAGSNYAGMTATAPFTLANGDEIHIAGELEIA